MLIRSIRIVLIAGLVVASATLAGYAQNRRGMSMPMYDPATEVTLRGEVTDVVTQTGRHGNQGVHVTLRAEAGPVDVHLGPAAYLEEHDFAIAKGDVLEVVGSKVNLAGGPSVLARTVKKGETVIVLRDEAGRPKWARARQGGG